MYKRGQKDIKKTLKGTNLSFVTRHKRVHYTVT